MTTTKRHYDTLTKRQQNNIREYIRRIWIEDAIEELRQYPQDDGLAEQLRALATNSEAALDLINDQLEESNPMYIEACGVIGIEIPEKEPTSIPSRYWEPGADEYFESDEPWADGEEIPFE